MHLQWALKLCIHMRKSNKKSKSTGKVGHIVRALKGTFQSNCAFCDTSMKLGELIEFDALKKIGLGPQLKNAF